MTNSTRHVLLTEVRRYQPITYKTDLWTISADSVNKLGSWINEWRVKDKQTSINTDYINDIAILGPVYIFGKIGCYARNTSIRNLPRKNDHLIHQTYTALNNNFKVATFPLVNALPAAMCTNDALKFLGGYGNVLFTHLRVGIWSRKLLTKEHSLTKNPHCTVCGTPQ
ncbi:hypothetical protein [Bartonella raoultii]|uniref:Uncharacterized protein n=1 Tax=Bartonella raoultii TaxID=1457020 RepID=A0ABS7I3D2_9HYPH|nr:hypothetical protein [Bartonella raoultii]MBX4335158.1 hypothetical protein [Bartonella raoultii]